MAPRIVHSNSVYSDTVACSHDMTRCGVSAVTVHTSWAVYGFFAAGVGSTVWREACRVTSQSLPSELPICRYRAPKLNASGIAYIDAAVMLHARRRDARPLQLQPVMQVYISYEVGCICREDIIDMA